MCGIAGFCALARGETPPPDLEAMTRRLRHRGPDSEGFYREPGVGLGIRRLKVIDLVTGDQPIANETGDVQVVQNGEIYNYRELRSQLAAKGHRFATASDTEVLVHGYEEWGAALPEKLRGMFAFAIWDRRTRSLLLARDHFGIKPLYYARTGDHLLFASEMKSILLSPEVGRTLDLEAIDQYLSFLYVPEPRTIYRSIRALPAGHTLTCRAGEITVDRYFSLQPGEPFGSRSEAISEVREVFEDSVRAMMVADVPLGLFLSSGVDSASILAMMARHSQEPVRTFSIGFGRREHRWDELEEIRELAQLFGTDHHEFRVEPDVVSQLPEVIDHFDQPFANPTAVILRLLSGQAREHTTVALSGTGGDELFAGYPRYLGMQLFRQYRRLPAAWRRSAGALARRHWRDATDGRPAMQRARRFLESAALPPDACYARMLVTIDDDRKRALYTPELAAELDGFDPSEFVRSHLAGRNGSRIPVQERLLATDISTYLPFNQLAYGDRMSMARSLEVRVPFVDQRLVEVAGRIPLAWNLRWGVTKSLLREAMSPYLPRSIVRRRKRGLNLPISMWLRSTLLPWMRSLLSPERLVERGYFQPEPVARLIDEQVEGIRDHSLLLWSLIVLELWHQRYVDDSGAPAAAGAVE